MEKIEELKEYLDKNKVKLVAVSKTKPVESILEKFNAGQLIFGENKVQELVEKRPLLPDDIEWHMIGHLQKNKVKYIAPFVAMIHSCDSLKLLKIINKEAKKNNRKIPVLLQLRIASEETKYGMTLSESIALLQSESYGDMKNIFITGVMGMATFTDNEDQLRSEFRLLKSHFDILKEKFFPNDDTFSEISMGMSGDYKIAVEEGSTMVRIGSLIFGARN